MEAVPKAGLVLLACWVSVARASGCSRSGLDEVGLIQQDLQRQKASQQPPALDPPAVTYEIGESVEVKGGAGHEGWFPCSIKSLGKRPNEYTISVPALGDLPVRAAALRKAQPESRLWMPHFAPGERVEVLGAFPPFVGLWVQARVLGQGNLPNTYYIRVPTSTADSIPDVPLSSLRKLHEPVVSGCSTTDRMQAVYTFMTQGNMVFLGWADKCENFMPANGTDYQRLDRCVQEIFPVSPMCSQCGVEFMKETMGTCRTECEPMSSSCTSFTSPSTSCMDNMVKCMDCANPALLTLFDCVGASDDTIAGKLAKLRGFAASRTLALPGMVNGIYTALLDGLTRSAGF